MNADIVNKFRKVVDALICLTDSLEKAFPEKGNLVEENNPSNATVKVDKINAAQPKNLKFEEVRSRLAVFAQEGKQAQIKALITEFGAKKLSDVPVEKYAELLEKAEGM